MKIFFTFLIVVLYSSSYGQDIVDLFLKLPDEHANNLSLNDRRSMIENFKRNIVIDSAFAENITNLDHKNGYLSIRDVFGDSFYETCYWNVSDGSKLIGVTSYGCGPVCITDFIVFYRYSDNKLLQLNTKEIIPFIEEIKVDLFFKDNIETADRNKFQNESQSFTYSLPRIGKNISISYSWVEYFTKGEIDKSLRGTILTLVWNNGTFEIGEVK